MLRSQFFWKFFVLRQVFPNVVINDNDINFRVGPVTQLHESRFWRIYSGQI